MVNKKTTDAAVQVLFSGKKDTKMHAVNKVLNIKVVRIFFYMNKPLWEMTILKCFEKKKVRKQESILNQIAPTFHFSTNSFWIYQGK